MSTITISLPAQAARQIDTETKKQGFATRSEFIRSLIRRYFKGNLSLEVFKPQPLDKVERDLRTAGKYNDKFVRSIIKGLAASSIYES